LRRDGVIDPLGVALEPVQLVGRERGNGAVGSGANLEDALGAVMGNEAGAEDFGQFSGGVATENIHLPQAVLRGDIALREDEIV